MRSENFIQHLRGVSPDAQKNMQDKLKEAIDNKSDGIVGRLFDKISYFNEEVLKNHITAYENLIASCQYEKQDPDSPMLQINNQSQKSVQDFLQSLIEEGRNQLFAG